MASARHNDRLAIVERDFQSALTIAQSSNDGTGATFQAYDAAVAKAHQDRVAAREDSQRQLTSDVEELEGIKARMGNTEPSARFATRAAAQAAIDGLVQDKINSAKAGIAAMQAAPLDPAAQRRLDILIKQAEIGIPGLEVVFGHDGIFGGRMPEPPKAA
jgi:hypothetical protein